MIAIFVIALILFGPKKLPELGRTLGKALSEFRRAKNELKATFESHLHELERETRAAETPAVKTGSDYPSVSYPYPYDENGRRDSGTKAWESQAVVAPEPVKLVEPYAGTDANSSAPVSGTVARSNGTSRGHFVSEELVPGGSPAAAAEQERPL